MAVFAYVRVSSDKQETENQKYEILKYANERKLGNVERKPYQVENPGKRGKSEL